MIRVGPIGISTSLGIFQYHLPSKKPIIPSGMNCLYCCQFCIVILVPGGIGVWSRAVSCASADDHSEHRIKLRPKRNLRAEFRPITLPRDRVSRNYTVSSRVLKKGLILKI